MGSLQFQYEIPIDEYVAAQLLYHKLRKSDHRIGRAAFWILLGAAFVVVAFTVKTSAWAATDSSAVPLIILAAFGISWIYGGIRMLFPARHFRRAYGSSALVGQSYKADIDEKGFHVASELCEWSVKWPAVQIKGEDERVFIFFAANTIFIFGKKSLSAKQQEELRKLGGLKS
ncbi:MAG: YcxB family protein [Candidatus Acidiferrales bacterium]